MKKPHTNVGLEYGLEVEDGGLCVFRNDRRVLTRGHLGWTKKRGRAAKQRHYRDRSKITI